MPDKIVNHFVLADGSTAKYDAGGLLNLDDTVSLAGYAPDAKAVGDRLTAVRGQVGTITQELREIATYVEPLNLFNKADAVTGYFYGRDNNHKAELRANTAFTCVKMSVEQNTTYTVSGVDYTVYFYDKDENTINPPYNTGASAIFPCTFTTPTDCEYVTLSWKHAKCTVDNYMVVKGENLPTSYTAYDEPYWKINDDVIVSTEKVYTVGVNGDYTSFTQCLLDLKDESTKKTIYVDAGQYDIFEEIGGSEYCLSIPAGTNWKDCNVFVPPNTKIIGLGCVELLFKPTAESIGQIASGLISPVNIQENAILENIYIDSENCRYGIHSDGSDSKVTQRFKNVHIKHRPYSGGTIQGFGAGCRPMDVFEFDNCYFDAWLPLSFHNNGSTTTDGTQITFNNCTLKSYYPSSQPSLRLGNVNPNQVKIDVKFNSCYLNSNVRIVNEGSQERPNAFAVSALNTSKISIDNRVATNIYTLEELNPIE